jgi:hypothetical protein
MRYWRQDSFLVSASKAPGGLEQRAGTASGPLLGIDDATG